MKRMTITYKIQEQEIIASKIIWWNRAPFLSSAPDVKSQPSKKGEFPLSKVEFSGGRMPCGVAGASKFSHEGGGCGSSSSGLAGGCSLVIGAISEKHELKCHF